MLITFAPSYYNNYCRVGHISLSPPFSFNKNNAICRQNINNLSLVKLPLRRGKDGVTTALAAHTTHLDGGAAGATSIAPEELHGGGIGIVKFLQGKNYLVTGATGFLAKVLIEKLLRTVPDLGKIFILVRAEDKEAAAERLKAEIIDSELFKSLEISHGKSYKAFMLSKVIPVAGSVCESNLGIESNLATEIMEAVDVIVNSSANTIFDERYDVAIDTNTLGPCRLLSFAKKCKNLSLFLHFSTAYVNGEKGIISEKPVQMGIVTAEAPDELNIQAEINYALNSNECIQVTSTQQMKDLGWERATRYGWQNTYSFTKAMGEMLINRQRGKIPVVIIRPSIIESSYKEPFPGWIEGNRMVDPLILAYGKGHLRGLLANPRAVIDIVPVDIVVNTALVAMARHGTQSKPGLNVYHAASSVSNPLLFQDIFKYSCDHFKSSPLIDTQGNQIGITSMKFFSSMAEFSAYISTEIAQRNGRLMDSSATSDEKLLQKHKMKCEKQERHILHTIKMYEPYLFYSSWYEIANVRKLINMMSEEEKIQFGCDIGNIVWEDYICKIHIPGFRKNVLKGRVMFG